MDDQAYSEKTAGQSARREYERRREAREKRVREKHPMIGGLVLALQGTPSHERAWATGAEGEAAVAEALERRCAESAEILHDLRMPGSRANIDHLAVACSGVWVIDAKKYKGRVKVQKPLFGKAKLTINGRDRSKLADGLDRQVAAIKEVLGDEVPVKGAFCLVGAELPLFGTLKFRGYPLLGRKKMAKQINAPGPLSMERRKSIAALLAERFVQA